MQTTSSVRKRFSTAQREELLSACRRSDLTQREFAQQHGIGLSTLQRWLHSSAYGPAPTAGSFVPVPNLLSAAPPPPVYRIEWPGGMSLEVRAGFVAEEVAALLQLLPAL